ncbi:MAG TPA: mechanosensitive ion channel domain-containing protein [Vicinamibacterales bacterium]|nr:mechanosensitive ion channel domain-containing protein [Vicinamibacterales bacterium]
MWYRIFASPPPLHVLVAGAVVTLAAAYVVAFIAARLVRAVLILVVGGKDVAARSSPAIRNPARMVGWFVFLLAAAAFFFPSIEALGYRSRAGLPLRTLSDWFFASGLRILLIGVLAYAAVRIVVLLVRRLEDDVSRSGQGLDVVERAKRVRTLGSLMRQVVTAAVLVVAALMILRELRLDIMPLLSAAGIAGIALGFGAQTLVRDMIAGFFLTFEDQVRVGDVVSVNNIGGLVEEINLRTIVMRDFDGTVHIVPAGTIATLSNKSRDFAYAVIDVTVGYEEDPDRVMHLLREVGASLQADAAWQPHVLAPMEVVGVESIDNWQVTIKLRMKTMALKQWDVGRELRRRIRRMLEANAIHPPVPRQDVVVRQV